MKSSKMDRLVEMLLEDDEYMDECPECGAELEDLNGIMICSTCGYSNEDEYPTLEDVLIKTGEYDGEDEDGDGETYDEVYNELSND